MDKERRVPLMNKKGSIFGKSFLWLLTAGMIIIILFSIAYAITPGKSQKTTPKNLTNATFFNSIWEKTKGIFTGTVGVASGAFAAIGFTTPRVWLDQLYIWPILLAAILYTLMRHTYTAIRINLKTPGTMTWELYRKSLFWTVNKKNLVYTFWILFIAYSFCWALPILKPLLASLFSDYKIKLTQASQSLTNISAIKGTFQFKLTKLNSLFLIIIRGIATALYVLFFFLVKELVKSLLKKTETGRAEIAEDIEKEEKEMKRAETRASIRVLKNIGKYMAKPTTPD